MQEGYGLRSFLISMGVLIEKFIMFLVLRLCGGKIFRVGG